MTDATPEDREKIKKALESGNVHWADDFEGLFNGPDGPFEIKSVRFWDKGMRFSWRKSGCGFGSFTLYIEDDKLKIDNETMKAATVKEAFGVLIDMAFENTDDDDLNT